MSIRLNKALKEFNIGKDTAVEFLAKKGHEIESNPNTKLSDEQYDLLRREFKKDEEVRRKATELSQGRQQEREKGSEIRTTGDRRGKNCRSGGLASTNQDKRASRS